MLLTLKCIKRCNNYYRYTIIFVNCAIHMVLMAMALLFVITYLISRRRHCDRVCKIRLKAKLELNVIKFFVLKSI